MNIPGFTAAASLYQASGPAIHRAPDRFATHPIGTVMPQMRQSGGHVLCTAKGCSCNSEERCNAMFSAAGLCGNDASCNEHGCHCSF